MKYMLLVLLLVAPLLQAMEPAETETGLRQRTTQPAAQPASKPRESLRYLMDQVSHEQVLAGNKEKEKLWAQKSRREHLCNILKEDTVLIGTSVSIVVSVIVYYLLLHYASQHTTN